MRNFLRSLWDALFPPLPTCEDCGVTLQGPEVELGGGYIKRNHFGDRCWACQMRRQRQSELDFIKSIIR